MKTLTIGRRKVLFSHANKERKRERMHEFLLIKRVCEPVNLLPNIQSEDLEKFLFRKKNG